MTIFKKSRNNLFFNDFALASLAENEPPLLFCERSEQYFKKIVM
jgi:hypothetical protein